MSRHLVASLLCCDTNTYRVSSYFYCYKEKSVKFRRGRKFLLLTRFIRRLLSCLRCFCLIPWRQSNISACKKRWDSYTAVRFRANSRSCVWGKKQNNFSLLLALCCHSICNNWDTISTAFLMIKETAQPRMKIHQYLLTTLPTETQIIRSSFVVRKSFLGLYGRQAHCSILPNNWQLLKRKKNPNT